MKRFSKFVFGSSDSILSKISLVLAVFLNLYPITGVLFFKWDLMFAMFAYASDTFILCIFATIKMVMSKVTFDPVFSKYNSHLTYMNRKETLGNFLFGMWISAFIMLILSPGGSILSVFSLLHNSLSVVLFLFFSIFSHCFSFFVNYLVNNERETLEISRIFYRVVGGRIAPMLIAPFFAWFFGFLFILLGISLPAGLDDSTFFNFMALLIFVSFFDISFYLEEHKVRVPSSKYLKS